MKGRYKREGKKRGPYILWDSVLASAIEGKGGSVIRALSNGHVSCSFPKRGVHLMRDMNDVSNLGF